MKVAFLSDVHANLPALRAALDVADRWGAERVVAAGDLVGDGPYPREVVALLLGRGVRGVRGNVDRKVLAQGTKRGKLEKRVEKKKGQRANLAWSALQLLDAEEERAWLEGLPFGRSFTVRGKLSLVVHGSPLGDTDRLFPSLTPEGLRGKLAGWRGKRPSLLVSGHTHVPFAREVDGVTVVNCGSVGRPADGDPRGSLALVEVDAAGAVGAEIVRFAYPVEEVVEALRARGVPGVDPEGYRRGVKS